MKNPQPSRIASAYSGAVLIVLMFISGCDDREKVCKKCDLDYKKEERVKQISHYNAASSLVANYNFYYADYLLDSIVKTSFADDARTADEDITTLKIHYPSGQCTPSYYVARNISASPISMEKAFLSVSGDLIQNKHISFYDDETFPIVSETAEIDYTYNVSDQLITRHGTDYGLLIYPGPYGNENIYTHTGQNISGVSAWKEQAGYDLTKTFDNRNNPFNIQSGVMYYLSLIAYTDDEYFETICKDNNNVTKIVYKGTDTSNSHVTITFTFTYSYNGENYPTKVHIYEVKEDEIYGGSEEDYGTFLFEYY